MLKRFTVGIVALVGFVTLSFAADENQNVCTGDPGQWQQLFDGRNLAGWKHVGPGGDSVEDGLIRTYGGRGLLSWTGGKVGNGQVQVVYKMRDENGNLGVFVRIPLEPRDEWMPVHCGHEVRIDNHPERSSPSEDEFHETGMLYSLTKPLLKNAWKPGPERNTMDITWDGPRTGVTLNGHKVTDFTEGDSLPAKKFDFEPQPGPRPTFGRFGLQNHSDNDIVFFKEVAIETLRK
jgi:Domain of Unknown Function (DUF1080)